MEGQELENIEVPLNGLGKVQIAPEVIQIISGMAALGVKGVAGTRGGVVKGLTQYLGRKSPKQGIKVELEEETRITVSVIVYYGVHLPSVGKEVQEKVKTAVESMTGLEVMEVKVKIVGVQFDGEQEQGTEEIPQRIL